MGTILVEPERKQSLLQCSRKCKHGLLFYARIFAVIFKIRDENQDAYRVAERISLLRFGCVGKDPVYSGMSVSPHFMGSACGLGVHPLESA